MPALPPSKRAKKDGSQARIDIVETDESKKKPSKETAKKARDHYNLAVERWKAARKAKSALEATLERAAVELETAAIEKDEARRHLEEVDGSFLEDVDPVEESLESSSERRCRRNHGIKSAFAMPAHRITKRMRFVGPLPGWYEGEMNGRHERHGRGTMQYDDGRVYDGEFVNNKMHGHGRCTWANGYFYEGRFVNGTPSLPTSSAGEACSRPSASANDASARSRGQHNSHSEITLNSATREASNMPQGHHAPSTTTTTIDSARFGGAAHASVWHQRQLPAYTNMVSMATMMIPPMQSIGGGLGWYEGRLYDLQHGNGLGIMHLPPFAGSLANFMAPSHGNYVNDTPRSFHQMNQMPLNQRSGEVGNDDNFAPSRERASVPSQGHDDVFPLGIAGDEERLSRFLCFVRKHCIDVFCASEEDVKTRKECKKISLKQVGIRCHFCANVPYQERCIRSSSFPSSLSRIYQSVTMMIRDHFGGCSAMPMNVKVYYLALKNKTTQSRSDAMNYWIESALKLGLVDTSSGIVLLPTSSGEQNPEPDTVKSKAD